MFSNPTVSKEEAFKIGLPKWPMFEVWGAPVTRQQASEILIRTNHWPVSINDDLWEDIIEEVTGVPAELYPYRKEGMSEADRDVQFQKNEKRFQDFLEKYKVLLLDYIANDQIGSAWIGGPHGWCSWDGFIGANTFNIGKWPDVESVYNEWELIAKAFPYLNLHCQLYNGEACEEGTKPVIRFRILNGTVTCMMPVDREAILCAVDRDSLFRERFENPYAERGCTKERLIEALKDTEESLKRQ